ncbi:MULTISPECIES: hypothetical protein [unclassified Pseudonocardia]|uniref:hypothetical protein n=1 Tax=unclassified Pseudonocardia TaxID=2619320 RepID=UPI0001FFE042|nr:hypothetical protein [Pseudonocardia sp. Ae707_Ps1]OLM17920.1 hypothetical protein Ae707Ps1_2179 [Pseudonocardia sp. Ae707_Ps1]
MSDLKERRAYAVLSDSTLQVLDERAMSRGMTRSQFLRWTILNELGIPQEPARVKRRTGDDK